MRIAAFVLLLWAGAATAAPIRIDFSGTVGGMTNTNIVEIGDVFTGFAVIDDETLAGQYEVSLEGITISKSVAPFHVNRSRAEHSALLNIGRADAPEIGRFDAEEFLLWFFAPLGTFEQGVSPYDLNAIVGGHFNARWRDNPGYDYFTFGGYIDSVQVPEPESVFLFAAALLGLMTPGRQKRVQLG